MENAEGAHRQKTALSQPTVEDRPLEGRSTEHVWIFELEAVVDDLKDIVELLEKEEGVEK